MAVRAKLSEVKRGLKSQWIRRAIRPNFCNETCIIWRHQKHPCFSNVVLGTNGTLQTWNGKPCQGLQQLLTLQRDWRLSVPADVHPLSHVVTVWELSESTLVACIPQTHNPETTTDLQQDNHPNIRVKLRNFIIFYNTDTAPRSLAMPGILTMEKFDWLIDTSYPIDRLVYTHNVVSQMGWSLIRGKFTAVKHTHASNYWSGKRGGLEQGWSIKTDTTVYKKHCNIQLGKNGLEWGVITQRDIYCIVTRAVHYDRPGFFISFFLAILTVLTTPHLSKVSLSASSSVAKLRFLTNRVLPGSDWSSSSSSSSSSSLPLSVPAVRLCHV